MHVEKIKSSQVTGLLMHDKRSIANHANEDIDSTKSHLNYNLVEGDPFDMLRNRLESLSYIKKKSTNVLCSWAVTCPKSLTDPDEQEQFFKESFAFLSERYGKKNVVSAIVHNDETTPHMHFKFVPAVTDKNGIEKLNCKAVINRAELFKIHKEAEQHMNKVFGRDGLILTGATANGNKTITEMKLERLQDEKNQLEVEIKEINTNLENTIAEVEKIVPQKPQVLKAPETKKSLLGGKEMVDKADYDRLAAQHNQVNKELAGYKNANQALQAKLDIQSKESWVNEKQSLEALNLSLATELAKAERELDANRADLRELSWYKAIYKGFIEFVADLAPESIKTVFNYFSAQLQKKIVSDLEISPMKKMDFYEHMTPEEPSKEPIKKERGFQR